MCSCFYFEANHDRWLATQVDAQCCVKSTGMLASNSFFPLLENAQGITAAPTGQNIVA